MAKPAKNTWYASRVIQYLNISGTPVTELCRPIPVKQSTAFFFASSAHRTSCIKQHGSVFVTFKAQEGQNIKLTLTELNTDSVHSDNGTLSTEIAYVVDGGMEHNLIAERDNAPVERTYQSESHMLTLVMSNSGTNFIVSFYGRYAF